MNFMIPIVFFCAFNPNDIHECNSHTASYRKEISPFTIGEDGLPSVVNTPISCLMAGWVQVAKEADKFKEANPDKVIEFRVVCKPTDQRI